MTTASREQALSALARANHVRTHNMRVGREIAALRHAEGLAAVAEIVGGDMDGPIGAVPVGRLLRSVRHVKDARVATILRAADVFDQARPLRRLTVRQRAALAYALTAAADYSRSRR